MSLWKIDNIVIGAPVLSGRPCCTGFCNPTFLCVQFIFLIKMNCKGSFTLINIFLHYIESNFNSIMLSEKVNHCEYYLKQKSQN